MTIMVTEPYDALRSAEGVSDEQARRAAEAAFDARFNGLERRIDQFQADVDRRFDAVDRRFGELETRLERRMDAIKADTDLKIEDLRGSLRVQQWMLATLVAGMAALLIRAFA